MPTLSKDKYTDHRDSSAVFLKILEDNPSLTEDDVIEITGEERSIVKGWYKGEWVDSFALFLFTKALVKSHRVLDRSINRHLNEYIQDAENWGIKNFSGKPKHEIVGATKNTYLYNGKPMDVTQIVNACGRTRRSIWDLIKKHKIEAGEEIKPYIDSMRAKNKSQATN